MCLVPKVPYSQPSMLEVQKERCAIEGYAAQSFANGGGGGPMINAPVSLLLTHVTLPIGHRSSEGGDLTADLSVGAPAT